MLAELGVRTVRESLRWHLIGEGQRDWSSAQGQIEAARDAGIEVIWDICHWGVPDGMDVMSPDWPARLADFTHDAATMLRAEGCPVAGWVPVNEMSFWSWAGGEVGRFGPHLVNRGDDLKRQLVCGHLAAVRALRSLGCSQPVVVAEPLIWTAPASDHPADVAAADAFVEVSLDAVRWVLEEDPTAIDVLGLNYYAENQWVIGTGLVVGGADRRGLASLLAEVAGRFPLPLALTETGAEEPDGDAWLEEIAREVILARRNGVRVEGVCVYPVTDYLGWEDDRHCPCGPIGMSPDGRFVRPGQAAAMRRLNAIPALTENGASA